MMIEYALLILILFYRKSDALHIIEIPFTFQRTLDVANFHNLLLIFAFKSNILSHLNSTNIKQIDSVDFVKIL